MHTLGRHRCSMFSLRYSTSSITGNPTQTDRGDYTSRGTTIQGEKESNDRVGDAHRPLKTFTIFVFFVIPWLYETYGMNIFVELVDNEHSGCRAVVSLNSRKWGYFWGLLCAAQYSSVWLVGLFQDISTREKKLHQLADSHTELSAINYQK